MAQILIGRPLPPEDLETVLQAITTLRSIESVESVVEALYQECLKHARILRGQDEARLERAEWDLLAALLRETLDRSPRWGAEAGTGGTGAPPLPTS